MAKIFIVTGSHGYIGSHICVDLLERGFHVVGIDNDQRSNQSAIDKLSACENYTHLPIDLTMRFFLPHELIGREFSVIHCAGLKDVMESIHDPVRYFANNVQSTLNLLSALKGSSLNHFVFSSTAAVYDPNGQPPFRENDRISPVSPYGRSKLAAELAVSSILPVEFPKAKAWILRYFNPVGCAKWWVQRTNPCRSRSLQDQLAWCLESRETFQVFRSGLSMYPGSCVRDFIRLKDLIDCHVQCCIDAESSSNENLIYLNVGTGRGVYVHELISEVNLKLKGKLNWQFAPHRDGEIPCSYADVRQLRRLHKGISETSLSDLASEIVRYVGQAKKPIR